MSAKAACFCFVLVGALAPSSAVAAPLCSSLTPANYATLMAQGATGCLLSIYNDLLFTNFTFASNATGTGTLPVASQISFTLDLPGTFFDGHFGGWGFDFDPNLSVSGIGSEDIQIAYDISLFGPGIFDRHLGEIAVVTNGAAATVTEAACGVFISFNGLGPCVPEPNLTVTAADPFIDVDNGFYSEVQVNLDIHVTSTTVNGTASISGVRDAVSVEPEPATVVLVLAGFASFAAWRKRCGFD